LAIGVRRHSCVSLEFIANRSTLSEEVKPNAGSKARAKLSRGQPASLRLLAAAGYHDKATAGLAPRSGEEEKRNGEC
jgi:hypothetical protein